MSAMPQTEAKWDELWGQICCDTVDGHDTLDVLVDHSFMRPRNLIKIFSYCGGVAINRDRTVIGPSEIKEGLKNFSDDVLFDLSNELRDLNPAAEDVLYQFIGEKIHFRYSEMTKILSKSGLTGDDAAKIIEGMIYFGVIAVPDMDGRPKYIYEMSYDVKKTHALLKKHKNPTLTFHPALHPALGLNW